MATKMKSNPEVVTGTAAAAQLAQARAALEADKAARGKAFADALSALCKEHRCQLVPMIQYVDGALRQAGVQVLVED